MNDLIRETQSEGDVPYWIFDQIVRELKRAEAKHPDFIDDDPIHAAAVVAEEAGELIRASLHLHYEGGNMAECQKEAIQTAVTAIRFLKTYGDLKFMMPQ